MSGDSGFMMASGFDPSMVVEQVGGWTIVVGIVAVVIVVAIVRFIFSVLKKVLAVVVTLALIAVLGGGFLGMATGWFDQVPGLFQSLFDNMPWS